MVWVWFGWFGGGGEVALVWFFVCFGFCGFFVLFWFLASTLFKKYSLDFLLTLT